MIITAATGLLSMLEAAMLAAGGMILTRCLRTDEARRSVDWQVIIVIAAAIALGAGLQTTGAALTIAQGFIGLVGDSPYSLISGLFILTAGFSAMISNVAAAVLIFPRMGK